MRFRFLAILILAFIGRDASGPSSVDNTRTGDELISTNDAIVYFGSSGDSTDVGEYYAKYTRRLDPAIKFIDQHVSQHGELPSKRAFKNWADDSGAHGLIIWDRSHDCAAEHGAQSENDYLVGAWKSDWYFYYKSLDGNYIDASDDLDWIYVYENDE